MQHAELQEKGLSAACDGAISYGFLIDSVDVQGMLQGLSRNIQFAYGCLANKVSSGCWVDQHCEDRDNIWVLNLHWSDNVWNELTIEE